MVPQPHPHSQLTSGPPFGVILADPPWRYENAGGNGAAATHYGTLATDELCTLPVAALAADDAVLLLWATAPMNRDAHAVIAAWGFTYLTKLVWIKLAGDPQR